MKVQKIVLLILVLGIILSMGACNNESKSLASSSVSSMPTPTETTAPESEPISEVLPTPEPTLEPSPEPEPKMVEMKIGEPATTDSFEIVLNECRILDSSEGGIMFVSNSDGTRGNNYCVPTGDSGYAKDLDAFSYTYVWYTYTIKNIGKKELYAPSPRGHKLVYGDGYEFEAGSATFDEYGYCCIDPYWNSLSFEKIGVLAEPRTCRGYFKVPLEVSLNEEEPLDLFIRLYDGCTVKYSIR